MMRDNVDDGGMSPVLKTVIIAAFIIITAVIIIFTVIEIVRNWKAGLYKASAYTDDVDNAEPEDEDAGNAQCRMRSAEIGDKIDDIDEMDEGEEDEFEDDYDYEDEDKYDDGEEDEGDMRD